MRSDLPTGTVTFLFTDVAGSTKLLHELGAEAYAEALAEHRRVIREACAAEGGVEVDTQGDAFFFAFPTAPGALAAAEAVTEILASGPIQVRVGLHTGTPLVSAEGYVGGDVHRAARIAAAGHGGQVLVSAATAQLVEVELIDLGDHRFKDLGGPERVYQVGVAEFAPLKSLYRTNLPIPATPFLGRERELDAVVSLIGRTRLLTLTGPGGTGKTRLALQAVAASAEAFADGVFWVPLAAVRDPELVLPTAAQSLEANADLERYVAGKRLLLLLDNFEQVVEAAPRLGSVLACCPNLVLVVTSRELLRVQGEVEYAVPPLEQREAVELFCARSQLEPSETVAELCRRLDDMPLAVELAAARTSALTPEQILERISQRLDLLKGGRDADPRQQTLRAAIEWSYELLTPAEQELFARLSVFAGGCTLEAAEEVWDAGIDTLQSLVEKSLIRFTGGRYWMLETIREYAAHRLEQAGRRDRAQRRHAAWMVRLAGEVGASRGVDIPVRRRFAQEHDNFRQALAWAQEEGHADVQLALIGRSWVYWWDRGNTGEGLRWVDSALTRSDVRRASRKSGETQSLR
jgi:predicted ATPase